jgi:hypothetical protein
MTIPSKPFRTSRAKAIVTLALACGLPAVRIPAKPIGHSGRCRSPVPARRSPGA